MKIRRKTVTIKEIKIYLQCLFIALDKVVVTEIVSSFSNKMGTH